jgi:hypothetical protein
MEAISVSRLELQDLILVAGHAAFKSTVAHVPDDMESDDSWVLQKFQIGEPPFYLEHIRRGVVLAANNPVALLVFSGGRTRPEAGDWSEAKTYHDIAMARRLWIPKEMRAVRDDVAQRTTSEEFARDSFENLLFGICRFQQVANSYPRIVTVASWSFKATRFDLHRAAIQFPATRFRFVGVNEPIDLNGALRGERKALESFIKYPFGTAGDLADKRATRNPFGQEHQYNQGPGVKDLFDFMDDPANASKYYTGKVPWQDAG